MSEIERFDVSQKTGVPIASEELLPLVYEELRKLALLVGNCGMSIALVWPIRGRY